MQPNESSAMRPPANGATRDPFDAPGARLPLAPGWLLDPQAVAARPGATAVASVKRGLRRWARHLGRTAWPSFESAPAYPLADAAFLRDLGVAERTRLEAAFRAAAPRSLWGSQFAARRHLDQLFPAAEYRDWSDLRGLHFVLGAAGTGKTTLVLRIAAAVRRAGGNAAVLSLFPERPARAAFLDAAAMLELPAIVVPRRTDWKAAIADTADRDVVFVDTPCFISQPELPWQLLALPELQQGTAVLHYVLCLHHRTAFVARQMQLAAAHRIHDLALTKVDLASGLGALLSLQLAGPRRIGFVSNNARLDTPPSLGPRALRRRYAPPAD